MPTSVEHRLRVLKHLEQQIHQQLTDNSKTVRWEITEAGRDALAELEGKFNALT